MSCPVSKAYNLDEIIQRRQNRNVGASERREVVAIDTETYNGDIILLADSDGNYLEHPDITLDNVIRFLYRHQYKWVFCWNLSYDGDVIAKLLGPLLNRYKYTGRLTFTYTDAQGRDYTIKYIENKSLTFSRNKHAATVYDVAQFFDRAPLATAYTDNHVHMGVQPLPAAYLEMKAKRAYFTLRYYRDHKKLVRNYCVQDCQYTKALADLWVDTFQATCGFYPSRWLSSGYLAEKMLIHNGIKMPYFTDVEYPIQNLARAAFYGARIETLYKGFVGDGYEHDINGAYPYAATTVPDLEQGRWIDSTTVDPSAKLGFFHIIARVPSGIRIAPFPFRSRWGMIFYPYGTFETYVTLPELQAVDQHYDKVRYRILEGYQFVPDRDDCSYILADFILKEYKRRLALKAQGSPLQQALKVLLNSIYGKTAQKTKMGHNRYVMGNLFCPVIASHITGFTRAQLLALTHSLGLADNDNVVAYATDSILTRRSIPNKLISNDLGGLKMADHGNDLFTIQNGIKRLNGHWKLRGIGYDNVSKVSVENTATKETPDGRVVMELRRLRPVRLKSAILRGRIQDVGKFQTFTREIDLNADRKRFWPAWNDLREGRSAAPGDQAAAVLSAGPPLSTKRRSQ
jgi:hypothetical protein